MKTDALVALLAAGAAPVPAHSVALRFAMGLSVGVPGALGLMLYTLGVRADLLHAATELMFWLKVVFAASLAVAALLATERLSHPGAPLGRVWLGLSLPLALLWLAAAVTLLYTAPAQRPALLLGHTWAACPFYIAVLSLPLFAATLWTLKGLAPTRLGLSGACAGLLSGALATLVYTLHCPESAAPFMAIWYVLGMALPTLLGAALGPRLLRW